MRKIPFDEIMKKPENWDDNVDIDAMNTNHELLGPIFEKFFFRDPPTNPKAFSLVLSSTEFAHTLLIGMSRSGIREPSEVIFCEYTREDKEKLVNLGIIHQDNLEIPTVIYTRGGDTFFVNLLL